MSIDLPTPKEFYRGEFNLDALKDIANNLDTEQYEGFVVRTTSSFEYKDFSKLVTKFVRKGHVQTDEHWLKNVKQNGCLNEIVKPKFMK